MTLNRELIGQTLKTPYYAYFFDLDLDCGFERAWIRDPAEDWREGMIILLRLRSFHRH